MLTRIAAASIALVVLAAPAPAGAQDAVAGAIVGALAGAAIASGAASVPYEQREPLREYIVRERRPSYRYEEEVVEGHELPRGQYESYEVPENYGPRGHHYAIVNERPVIFHPETRRIIHVYE